MASGGSGSGTGSSSIANNTKRDPAWKYNFLKDPKNPNSVTCSFCQKTTNGGIYRAKQHQIGIFKNVKACAKCPDVVKEELLGHVNEKKKQKSESYGVIPDLDDDDLGDDIEEVPRDEVSMTKQSAKLKGPMDVYYMHTKGKGIPPQSKRQTNIVEAYDKEARAKTIQYIARFFYQANVAFNAANLESFKWMVEAIGRHGPHLKPPSAHELRVPLLQKEVIYTNDLLKGHEDAWNKHGCSIMSDSWTDRKHRTLINFLVNCPLGTKFVESVDASSYMKTGEKTYELLDIFVEKVGEKNVVQVVTDNGSNFKLAGKLLEAKRPYLFWAPCAAHCVDLMLEDIGKLTHVKKVIERAIIIVGFIYNHAGLLNLMREYTNNKELVRCGATRFATTFLTMQSVHKQKRNLRNMFGSEKWQNSKWSKDAKGKRVSGIIFMPAFWNAIVFSLKVMGPLVRVLRLADNEKKPAMGYIYEAMDRAKECIQKSFQDNTTKYREVFAIIDNRWECQMHHPLHAAGHYLNPEYFYKDPSIEFNNEIVLGLYKCIERLVPDIDLQDRIMSELPLYKNVYESFGSGMAIRGRTTKAPAEWQSLFGCSTPNLQQVAIKILSLTCSASGCERNWSVFEQIHTKRRNRLEHKRLQDLVYVKYNQKLRARRSLKGMIDPISLDDIDNSNEWLVGQMENNEENASEDLIFDDDTLTWGDVARASGATEPNVYTRRHVNLREKTIGQGSSRATEIDDDLEESHDDSEEEQYDSVDEDIAEPEAELEDDEDFDFDDD